MRAKTKTKARKAPAKKHSLKPEEEERVEVSCTKLQRFVIVELLATGTQGSHRKARQLFRAAGDGFDWESKRLTGIPPAQESDEETFLLTEGQIRSLRSLLSSALDNKGALPHFKAWAIEDFDEALGAALK